MQHPTTTTLTTTADQAGERLDRLIAAELPELSRSRAKALIEQGHVTLTGAEGTAATIDDPSYRVKPGQMVRVTVPLADEPLPSGQAIPLTVIYEDADLIVIDKPAGMVVHPAPGNPDRTLVNALIAHCGDSLSGIGGVKRPGIVHRIDKDTSGLLVAAKNDATHQALSAAFARHDIERSYQCLVWGVPQPREGRIEGNIGRNTTDRKKMAVVRSGGKTAVTHYRVLGLLGDGAALVECQLETGRTHQIRVHLSTMGHPLIGDQTYGRVTAARRSRLLPAARTAALAFPRQALHAATLGLTHPKTGIVLRWHAPVPSDMAELIQSLKGH